MSLGGLPDARYKWAKAVRHNRTGNVSTPPPTTDMIFRGPLLHPRKIYASRGVGFVDCERQSPFFASLIVIQTTGIYAFTKSKVVRAGRRQTQSSILQEETSDYTYPLLSLGLRAQRGTVYVFSFQQSQRTFIKVAAIFTLKSSDNTLTFLTSPLHQSIPL